MSHKKAKQARREARAIVAKQGAYQPVATHQTIWTPRQIENRRTGRTVVVERPQVRVNPVSMRGLVKKIKEAL